MLSSEVVSTIRTLDLFATVVSYQGRYEQKEEMHRQELTLNETVLAQEHPRRSDRDRSKSLAVDWEVEETTSEKTRPLRDFPLSCMITWSRRSFSNMWFVLAPHGWCKIRNEKIRAVVSPWNSARPTKGANEGSESRRALPRFGEPGDA